jgi:hypothetical protein
MLAHATDGGHGQACHHPHRRPDQKLSCPPVRAGAKLVHRWISLASPAGDLRWSSIRCRARPPLELLGVGAPSPTTDLAFSPTCTSQRTCLESSLSVPSIWRYHGERHIRGIFPMGTVLSPSDSIPNAAILGIGSFHP